MPSTPIIQGLSHTVNVWQWTYILSISVALLSTFAIVVFAFHIQERKVGLKVSNYIYVIASLLAVVSTIFIVVKTNSLDKEKDRVAGIEIAQAKAQGASAAQSAATANKRAADAELKNSQLKIELAEHEKQEKEAEARLASQNQQLTQFTQGIAAQQRGIEQHMETAPTLTEVQVAAIAQQLKPFAGMSVGVHMVTDIPSQRLAEKIEQALEQAGIKINAETDLGADYRGVMIVVHSPSPAPHPAIADAIRRAMLSVGLFPKAVAFKQGGPPKSQVWLCVGPE